jgi:hypothetical protein
LGRVKPLGPFREKNSKGLIEIDPESSLNVVITDLQSIIDSPVCKEETNRIRRIMQNESQFNWRRDGSLATALFLKISGSSPVQYFAFSTLDGMVPAS